MRERALANPQPLCMQCHGSGVIADPQEADAAFGRASTHGRIVRCPCGKSPGQHSVRKRLKQQEETDARMRAVMLGKGW